jgi:hypothetical protein
VSEYQYYEFRAVDRPLNQRDMAALRQITSRAEITPTGLVNEYHWGDFKGDPDRLMDRHFDAHLYLANWGSRRLMLRLPADALDPAALKPYCASYVLAARATERHTVLDFHSEEEDAWDTERGEGWLDELLPLRSDLMTGDLRSLYLCWLNGVAGRQIEEDEPEPPVPPGLGKLSKPLKRLAEFLRVDQDLLEEAATVSGERSAAAEPTPAELTGWVTRLPAGEKDRLLVQMVQGESPHLREELLRRYRKERAPAGGEGTAAKATGRTAGGLLQAAERRADVRQRRQEERAAKARERRAREQAEARARHLDSLAGREPELWQQVEAAIATRQPKEYDQAVSLLKDLRDLADRSGTTGELAAHIRQLRERHRSKSALTRRLNQAGLRG